MIKPLDRQERHIAADDHRPRCQIRWSAVRLQRCNDSAQRPFARPAISDAFDVDARVFFRSTDDAHRRARRRLQSSAKPRDQWLSIELDERFIAPEAAAGASGKNETPHVCSAIHEYSLQ